MNHVFQPLRGHLLAALMGCASLASSAQTLSPDWQRASWEVTHNEILLDNPWVGGLTAPQWSPFDADLDGDEDLFAFDRDGSRLLLFERIPSETNPEGSLVMRWDWVQG